jgi:hypothetical protein
VYNRCPYSIELSKTSLSRQADCAYKRPFLCLQLDLKVHVLYVPSWHCQPYNDDDAAADVAAAAAVVMQIYRRPLGMEEVMALGKPLGRHCKELILHHLEIESRLVEEAERVMHVYYPCLGPDSRLQALLT